MRLTVIGGRFFAARITGGGIDWRTMGEDTTYEAVAVPKSIVGPVTKFMAHYGLVYGAFDFAVSKSGPWYFLECNPNGQFGFVEAKTGMAIAGAIADELVQGPDSLMRREGLAYGHRQSSGQDYDATHWTFGEGSGAEPGYGKRRGGERSAAGRLARLAAAVASRGDAWEV